MERELNEEAVGARKRPRDAETETVAQEPQFGKYTEQKLINELARVATREEDAEAVICEAGFPRSRVPRFTTPLHYWSKIVELADSGIVEHGSKQILRAAVRLFPYNKNFAECLVGSGNDQRSTWSLRLELHEIPDCRLNEILDILRTLSGDPSISLIRRHSGSIVLVLDILDQAAARIRTLAESGVLLQALGPSFMSFSKTHKARCRTDLIRESSRNGRRIRGILYFDIFTETPQLEIRGRGEISVGIIAQIWDKIPWGNVYGARILLLLTEVDRITPDAHRLLSRLLDELVKLGATTATLAFLHQAKLLNSRYPSMLDALLFLDTTRALDWFWGETSRETERCIPRA